MMYFYWSYLILFYIVLLLIFRSLIIFNEKQKGSGSRWKQIWGGSWKCRVRENHNQVMFCGKKNLLSIKEK